MITIIVIIIIIVGMTQPFLSSMKCLNSQEEVMKKDTSICLRNFKK